MAKFRRSIFLINKPFQFKFAFYLCSWLLALSLMYPLLIHELFNFCLQLLKVNPASPEFQKVSQTQTDVVILLFLLQLLFLAITAALAIFLSHRIAGPLYKLTKYFEEARHGTLRANLKFRQGDYFQELAQSYNEMMESIRSILARNVDSTNAAAERISKVLPQTSGEVRRELEEALTALKETQERTTL